jgi:hypothetical protein
VGEGLSKPDNVVVHIERNEPYVFLAEHSTLANRFKYPRHHIFYSQVSHLSIARNSHLAIAMTIDLPYSYICR